MNTYEDVGIRLSVDGYSDKILAFVATFIDLMLSCAADDGIDEALVLNSFEKKHRQFKNLNLDVDTRCNSNRKQYLMPDLNHPCQMERKLKDCCSSAEARSQLMEPSKFLRDRILARVTKIRVLVSGNTSKKAAKAFC